MTRKIDLNGIVESIRKLPGVQSARVWNRVPGKERIYIDLTKHNGGRNWNGGRGNTVIVHIDGRVDVANDWAGAATFNRHEELGTVEAIEAIVAGENGGESEEESTSAPGPITAMLASSAIQAAVQLDFFAILGI